MRKVLIANRGAIACRIIRTLRRMGLRSVAVYSDADLDSLHVRAADEAVHLGESPAAKSYLDIEKVLQAAADTGSDAIHPGYGFLSENSAFAEACVARGIRFIGPTPDQMRLFGLKHTARQIAARVGVPMLEGTGLLSNVDAAVEAARRVGYPVMLKSTAGGGGIGMQVCRDDAGLLGGFETVERLGQSNFKDGGVFLEKFVEFARHIEVQIFGDGEGRVEALGERDCSVQRRNQKVVEETPAPNLPATVREDLLHAARRLGEAASYRSAGTVEFLYDASGGRFYFLEVNTRLQVEHGVTEEVLGIDLVEWMVKLAFGEFEFPSIREPAGHSIQVRLYAEDPNKGFQPSTGLLTEVAFPHGLRCETWIERGSEVSGYYDPMLAILIATAPDRRAALSKMAAGLDATAIGGIETNLSYLRSIIGDQTFSDGGVTTQYLSGLHYRPRTIEVIDGGLEALVVDWPGRTGYWDVGVPPSGPMDPLSFRLGNRLLGNPEGIAGLEMTVSGGAYRLVSDSVFVLAGATMKADLEGASVPMWAVFEARAGQTLRLGGIEGPGQRTYLLLRDGIAVPEYLGSATTFRLGMFGGHGGRKLLAGDVLHLAQEPQMDAIGRGSECTELSDTSVTSLRKMRVHSRSFAVQARDPEVGAEVPEAVRPTLVHAWEVLVLYGPHGAPDFFAESDIATFFNALWEVHYNSARTGIRLIGPKPTWARPDGGEAGLHPSNIHDTAYSVGAIDYTGDMPVILAVDGPSLGGFVCPATIIQSELWKMGQLKPGDTVRFRSVSPEAAMRFEKRQNREIIDLAPLEESPIEVGERSPPIISEDASRPVAVAYRRSGDRAVLVEYGPMALDLGLRFRVHALMLWLREQRINGIEDLTPGIRSLQVRYDSLKLDADRVVSTLVRGESELPSVEEMEVVSRTVHLPLSWDDPSTRLAIEKYTQSVRKDAPWCPSNIEFIRRINGLTHVDDVKRIVFDASYLVMGLGDVYLGAPVATPVDPRHRLVTTKYNPARTWTPENAVGIGGAYMCVYGMEGPGGYQFVGRTVPVWNRWRTTDDFRAGSPWLLRFFDQIRFHPVEAGELLDLRRDVLTGRHRLRIEEKVFRLAEYRRFLSENRASIETFKATQQRAFEEERGRWQAAGQMTFESDVIPPERAGSGPELFIPEGCIAVSSGVAGSVWKVSVEPGTRVGAGDTLVVVESMKMEIAVVSPQNGVVEDVLCRPESPVRPGQALVVLRTGKVQG